MAGGIASIPLGVVGEDSEGQGEDEPLSHSSVKPLLCFIRVLERLVRGGGWKGKFPGDGGLAIGPGGGIGGGGD